MTDESVFEVVDASLPRIYKKIEEQIAAAPNYTRVILLGSSGASKSSICNALVGDKLTINVKDNMRTYLTCKNPKFPMGEHMISTTSDPNIYIDNINKLIICDAPGFDDNRGIDQDIINSFAINQLFSNEAKIKIIFVFSIHEGDISNGRGRNVAQNMNRVFNIIPDEEKLQKAMCLVVSHGKKDGAKNLIKDFKTHPDHFFSKMIKYFYKNMKEKVFSFPQALVKNVGGFYDFSDRERLLKFLHSSPVSHLPHKVVLSDKAQNLVHNIVQNYGTIEELTIELINNCKPIYQVQNVSLEVLNEWKMSFNSIVQNMNSIKTPHDLAILIEKYIKHPDLINKNVEKIRCYQSIFDFMNSIDNFGKNKIVIEKKIKSLFKNEIILIDEKIKSINSDKKLKKSEKESKEKSDKIDTLVKEKQEQSNELIRLSGTISTLNSQIQKSQDENQTLTDRISALEDNLSQRINEANKYGEQIALLIQTLKDGQDRNDRELAQMRQQMAIVLKKYDKTISKMDKELKRQNIGKFFGPLAPLYHLGIQMFDLIKGDSDDDDDDEYNFNMSPAIDNDNDIKYLKYDDNDE